MGKLEGKVSGETMPLGSFLKAYPTNPSKHSPASERAKCNLAPDEKAAIATAKISYQASTNEVSTTKANLGMDAKVQHTFLASHYCQQLPGNHLLCTNTGNTETAKAPNTFSSSGFGSTKQKDCTKIIHASVTPATTPATKNPLLSPLQQEQTIEAHPPRLVENAACSLAEGRDDERDDEQEQKSVSVPTQVLEMVLPSSPPKQVASRKEDQGSPSKHLATKGRVPFTAKDKLLAVDGSNSASSCPSDSTQNPTTAPHDSAADKHSASHINGMKTVIPQINSVCDQPQKTDTKLEQHDHSADTKAELNKRCDASFYTTLETDTVVKTENEIKLHMPTAVAADKSDFTPQKSLSTGDTGKMDNNENKVIEAGNTESQDANSCNNTTVINPGSPSLSPRCVSSFELCTAKELTNEIVEDLLHLTKHNMEDYYVKSNWGWDDVKKRGELCQDQMYYILVRSHTVRGLVSFDSCEACSKNKKQEQSKVPSQHNNLEGANTTANHWPVSPTPRSKPPAELPLSPLRPLTSPVPIVKCIIKFGKPSSGGKNNKLNASVNAQVERLEKGFAGSSAPHLQSAHQSAGGSGPHTPTATKAEPSAPGRLRETGKLVGFAAFSLTVDNGVPLLYVRELQLVPGVRGKGLGSYLMKHIEEVARRSEKSIVMLTVFSRNQPAARFYRRIGYSVDECSPGVCYTVRDNPYEIMSKVLHGELLRIECTYEGCKARFRFYNGLRQHLCARHGEPWPFPCRVEGCGQGVVLATQLPHHLKSHGVVVKETPKEQTGYVMQTRQTASNGGVRPAAPKNDSSKLLFQRVVVTKTGRKGTVLKANGSGVYKIKLDGPKREIVRLRRGLFEAKDVGQYVPKKRKERDPDWEFAMALQRQESRRSSRSAR